MNQPTESHRTLLNFQFKDLRGHLNGELVLRGVIKPTTHLILSLVAVKLKLKFA